MKRETLKQAGYVYIRKYGDNLHILENIKASKPYQFELWANSKNYSGYALIYKNTHLEFCSFYKV